MHLPQEEAGLPAGLLTFVSKEVSMSICNVISVDEKGKARFPLFLEPSPMAPRNREKIS